VAEFPEREHDITLRHLLTHTSGIRHYDFSDFSESNSQVQYQSLTEPLVMFSHDPLLFQPGQAFHYSSFGYNLAGAAIESATGLTFGEALETHLVQPMGLTGITVDNPAEFVQCRPDFYTIALGRIPIRTIWRNHSDAYPSAGVLSTAEDLARFADAYFHSDYLSTEYRNQFTRPATLADGQILNQSLGWEIAFDEAGAVIWYGHGGTTNGAYASLRYYPESKLTIAGISNYNYWLTDRRPEFFEFVRETLPRLFTP
jgi:CubicO group peptidase (beta-lactamase class C family)